MANNPLTIFYPVHRHDAPNVQTKGSHFALATGQGVGFMGNSFKSAQFLMEARMSRAAYGSADDCFDLGVAYSCGTGGLPIDLVEAHKWFNLAAMRGSQQGQSMRAEIAEEMTARQIAEAQRQARALIAPRQARAA
jgi:uncharacterized protein|tara:strand:+ start:333 stop:740 length:408 start_codon:yes stop_codon:yes gene_type:complete